MLYLLKSGFRRDFLIYLLAIIIIISALSLLAGYLADNYFGNTVSELIGDYGEFDLVLTVNREVKKSALTQIRDILRVKLPGSRVEQGVSVAGKTNFFVQLDEKYRTREYFMQMNSLFNNVSGLVGVTIMTEPRITVRGVPQGLVGRLEPELNSIEGVKFSYLSGGSGIDLMLNSSKNIEYVTNEVKKVLNKYKILEVRFPIDKGPVDTVSLGEKLANELKEKYNLEFAHNLTTDETGTQQYLINTMLEMKNFLLQYATVITIPLSADNNIVVHENDYLIIPGPGRSGLKPGEEITPMDLKLQVIKIDEEEIQALIVEGNVTDISSTEVYLYNDKGQITSFLGSGEVKSPREDLKYAAQELAKILPDLDKIFKNLYYMADEALEAIEMYSDTMVQIKDVRNALKEGQARVEEVKGKLTEIDLTKIQRFVTDILAIVSTAEDILTRMDWAKKELVKIDHELAQFQDQVDVIKKEFGVSQSYGKQLDGAVDIAGELQKAIRNNTGEVLEKLNEYNPVLKNISNWREDLEKLEQMIKSGDLLNKDTHAATEILDRLIQGSETTMQYLGRLDDKKMNEQVHSFKESLEKVKNSDVEAIIRELNYISETLPKLRDEEVTKTIKLIENYMSGQIIPGKQILIMVPETLNIKDTRPFIMEVVGQPTISVFNMDAGTVQPNIRGEFYRIISEVRETITAMVAIGLMLLVLILDVSGVMSVIKELRQRKNHSFISKIFNSEVLVGVIFGSLGLEIIFRLTSGQLPYIEDNPGLWIGGIIGLAIALLTDRINPVNRDEYMAGEALGFNFSEILREIVIPAGKPGLLLLLNRRNLLFK